MYVFTKKEIAQWAQEKYNRKSKLKKWKYIFLIAVFLFCFGYFIFLAPNAFAVLVNNERVAVVKEKEAVEMAVVKLIEEKGSLDKVGYAEKISFDPVKAKKKDIFTEEQLDKVLRSKITITAKGVLVKINGKNTCIAESKDSINQVLENIKGQYAPKDGSLALKGVKFKESIDLETINVSADKISNPEQVMNILHGDKPKVNVVTVAAFKTKESIPFTVEVVKDNNLGRGTQKVKQEGVNGTKEVTYQLTSINGKESELKPVAAQVLAKPESKVVLRGTSIVLASRSGGSGFLNWPIRGRITSPYGARWGGQHTGMDIDGSTGSTIRAAEDGTVTSAGWQGGYGYMVAINHGDGLVTRYAHNSKLNVSIGDKVKAGQKIAEMGSTGNSTGSHLHFEVLVNGSFKDPKRYLK